MGALEAIPIVTKLVMMGIAALVLWGIVGIIGDAREKSILKKEKRNRGKAAKRKRKVTDRGRPSPGRLRSHSRRSR